MDNFQDNVNLTLYPYGKTKYHIDNNGKYIFKCLNEDECVGNKIHACSVKLIDGGKDTPGFGYNKKRFGLINCLMANATTDKKIAHYPLTECAVQSHVEIAADILECSKGQKGEEFLAGYSYPTEKLNLQSIPLVVFNKNNDPEVSKAALKNFQKILCEQFKEDKPAPCSGMVTMPRLVTFFAILVHIYRRTTVN